MIAVISDLHFEEESSDSIPGGGGRDGISVPRNISAAPYRRLISDLARAARRNEPEQLRLVLAGDIFELFQTSLWHTGKEQVRPYDEGVAEGSALEAKILSILDASAEEEPVKDTLDHFRMLVSGRYVEESEERDFPVPASIEYIPGNHDRLVNATPAIRRKVRQLLGMGNSSERFPNYLLCDDPSVLIRHGHEYDPYNFSADYSDAEHIPAHIPQSEYDAPAFGDFITIEVVARLPVEYRRVHTPEGILDDPVKRAVYRRLLGFEDVRPQSALIPYLLKMPKHGYTDGDVWDTLEPVVRNILDDLHDHPFLHRWLDEWGKRWRPDKMNLARIALRAMSWRKGMTLTEAKALGWVADKAEESVVALAAREEALNSGKVRSVVCGHTHHPTMEVATTHGTKECHFFDVGTWRHRIPLAHDESGFGVLKSLTYLILYGTRESDDGEEFEAFDYWSGLSRSA